jgi:putative nucleotidyltransferase with HDIG domain
MQRLGFFEDFFEKYTAGFDTGSDEVRRGIEIKRFHSLEVYKFARRICDSLNLSKADYLAAMTVALFHDIGRFEQFKHFKTYVDRDSVNHAAWGVKVLRELGILNDFKPETRKDILVAIACHNKPHIPELLSTKAAQYCRIARDADKLDIFRVVIEVYESNIHDPVIMLDLEDSDSITPEVAEAVITGEKILYHKMKTTADFKMVQLGWFDELCFPESLRIAAEKEFAKKIIEALPDAPLVRCMQQKIKTMTSEAI